MKLAQNQSMDWHRDAIKLTGALLRGSQDGSTGYNKKLPSMNKTSQFSQSVPKIPIILHKYGYNKTEVSNT